MTHLRQVMNAINIFTDGDQCIQFLEEAQDEKVCIVVPGSLAQLIVPYMHTMSQVDSIFIFCGDKHHHEQWTKDWSKVKGVHTDITLICDALKQSAKNCEQNAIGFSLVATGGESLNMNLDRLDPMFMYTQILKEILLTINFEQKHFFDFINYCRKIFADNPQQLNNVTELEDNYRKKSPVWWYTWKSLLYPMLNRALRLSNIDVIVKIGFFIGDLHRRIDELHRQQYGGSNAAKQFIVYRGQGMSIEEFENISKTKGDLIAFNNFLWTSETKLVPAFLAESNASNSASVGVLFEMKIDSKQSTAPFASVAAVGAFGSSEHEILFAMHTVFRIRHIEPMNGNARLFLVQLELTSDNDKDLQVLTKHIRAETYPDEEGWGRLGLVLRRLGKLKQAEDVYQILLKQESNESQMECLYNQLGLCKEDQGEYAEAVRLYEKAIAIVGKYHPNSFNLARIYNNIGNVYCMIGEYGKALSSYQKYLEITKQSLPANHPDLAASYSNIGLVYDKMAEHGKALSSYEKALAIRQQSLPANHPHLAASYSNIGNVHDKMGEYGKALSSHEKALAIYQQSLPANHPHLAMPYNNIGLVYSNMGEYGKALLSYEKALAICQQSLPANHPHLAASYNKIGAVYEDMKNYSKAYSFYEKALKLFEQSLPPNHLNIKMCKNNLDQVKKKS